MPLIIVGAIPVPADQPIVHIKDLDTVAIPTMEIKVTHLFNMSKNRVIVYSFVNVCKCV